MANRVELALMLTLEIGMRVNRGFTLIELLIVIVIVGICSSVALLAFGDFGGGRKVNTAAEQLVSYLKLLQQRAILTNSTAGIKLDNTGYTTWQLIAGKTWQPMPENTLFHKHFFPKNTALLFNKTKIAQSPDIIIDSSGDMSEFQLTLGTLSDPSLVILTGKHNGALVLSRKSSE